MITFISVFIFCVTRILFCFFYCWIIVLALCHACLLSSIEVVLKWSRVRQWCVSSSNRNMLTSSMVFPINSCTIANLSACYKTYKPCTHAQSWVCGQEAWLKQLRIRLWMFRGAQQPFWLDFKQGFLVQWQKSSVLWAACPLASHSDWWSCIFIPIAVYFRVNCRPGAAH